MSEDLQAHTVRIQVWWDAVPGSRLGIVGSLPELGRWNVQKAVPLALVPGSSKVWTAEVQLSSPSFMYQYVIEQGGRFRREGVPQRIADIRALPHDESGCAVMTNAWEAAILRLALYHPLPEGWLLAVKGDGVTLGDWNTPQLMALGPERRLRNGECGRCWELEVQMPPQGGRFEYRYGALDCQRRSAQWARDPASLLYLPPMHVIENGVWEQFDANFVTGMELNEVTPYNFAIGPYPQSEAEVRVLREHGITAVLNLQTDTDFEERWIDWNELCAAYIQAGIVCRRCPIVDFDRKDLVEQLPQAAAVLKALLDAGHRVFVHCTAGMSRSCATGILYLVKYHEMDADAALQIVKQFRKVAAPDMDVIRKLTRRSSFLRLPRPFS